MNIVGEGFAKEITDQIDTRQKLKGNRDRNPGGNPEWLVWQNGNTGWVKMISSINVDPEKKYYTFLPLENGDPDNPKILPKSLSFVHNLGVRIPTKRVVVMVMTALGGTRSMAANTAQHADDERRLAELGYKQQFIRRLHREAGTLLAEVLMCCLILTSLAPAY